MLHVDLRTDTQTRVHLPISGSACIKLQAMRNSSTVCMLLDDGRLHFVDLERHYAVVCTLSHPKRFVDFDLDDCGNLLLAVTTDGDVELHRTKTLLLADFASKSDELKKGGNSLSRVQHVLQLVEQSTVAHARKDTDERRLVGIASDFDIIDNSKLLRENWLAPLNHPNFTLKGLRMFLKKNAVFPDAHRGTIWSFLLDLPHNTLAFDNLIKKGVHRDFEDISKLFPLKNASLSKRLARVLSCLAHYCPLFSDTSLVPFLVFPFVKLFPQDDCLAFEVTLTFLLHWEQHLFEQYPHPSAILIDYVCPCNPDCEPAR